MSLYDFKRATEIWNNEPFYGLLMAAMLKADTDNTEKFKRAWPDVWSELERRYHAPGGVLPEDNIE